MKKKIVIVAALLAALFTQAREIKVVLKGISESTTGETEVITREPDTLSVIPGRGVENIYVTLRDSCGQVMEYYCVPATWEDCLSVVSPALPNSYTLEIRDDRGVIYTKND